MHLISADINYIIIFINYFYYIQQATTLRDAGLQRLQHIIAFFWKIHISHMVYFVHMWKYAETRHLSTYALHVSSYATAYFSLFKGLKLKSEPTSPQTGYSKDIYFQQ